MSKPGKVWLVGAGPGDPDLLTVKAVRALGAADVVLHDDLVHRAILEFARPGARLVHVGKRGGCRSTPQAFIERLMVRYARAGASVVRLKGGDPFVFGRGGEERETLQRAGIEVEVVPGITAGLGAAATLGIPVTHRACANGVTLVTGHTRDGGGPNWPALARSATTLVIYMGIARLEQICQELMAAGLPGDTPAAVIQNATLPTQISVQAPLAKLSRAVNERGLGSPAIVLIGAVVERSRPLREQTPIDAAAQPALYLSA